MEEQTEDPSQHYTHSTLRERIVEHVFVGDTLRRLWQLGVTDVEVMRSEFDAYLWFDGLPGERLPDICDLKIAKHTKANADGIKLERPNHRVIPRGNFERLDTLDAVLLRLFGAFT
jgi:hypothetical protein